MADSLLMKNVSNLYLDGKEVYNVYDRHLSTSRRLWPKDEKTPKDPEDLMIISPPVYLHSTEGGSLQLIKGTASSQWTVQATGTVFNIGVSGSDFPYGSNAVMLLEFGWFVDVQFTNPKYEWSGEGGTASELVIDKKILLPGDSFTYYLGYGATGIFSDPFGDEDFEWTTGAITSYGIEAKGTYCKP